MFFIMEELTKIIVDYYERQIKFFKELEVKYGEGTVKIANIKANQVINNKLETGELKQ